MPIVSFLWTKYLVVRSSSKNNVVEAGGIAPSLLGYMTEPHGACSEPHGIIREPVGIILSPLGSYVAAVQIPTKNRHAIPLVVKNFV